MIIASYLPPFTSSIQNCAPNSYLYTVHHFLNTLAEQVEKVFICNHSEGAQLQDSQHSTSPKLRLVGGSELAQVLSEQPIDIWHDFGFHSPFVLKALRGSSGQEFSITYEVPPEYLLGIEACELMTLKSHDAVIYPLEKLSEFVHRDERYSDSTVTRDIKPSSQLVIPLGIDLESVRPMDKHDARCLLGYRGNDTVVLCHLELSSSSRSDLVPVFDAVRKAATAQKNTRLIISGTATPSLLYELRQLAYDSVGNLDVRFYLNPVAHAVPLLFSAADIFLLPSDGFSREALVTTTYAMAHKLPIILPEYCLAKALIEHEQSGLLVESYANEQALEYCLEALNFLPTVMSHSLVTNARGMHSAALVGKLVMMIQKPEWRTNIGVAAFNRAKRLYDIKHTVRAYVQLWQSLVNARSTRLKPQKTRCLGRNRKFLIETQPLNENLTLMTSDRGLTMLKQPVIKIPYYWREWIYGSIVLQLLRASQEGATIGNLTRSLLETSGCTCSSYLKSGILYHIGWCLNEGLLESAASDIVMKG